MDMEEKIRKIYYSIGEVSEKIGEPVSLVRFWSDSFPDLIRPERNKKGNRKFTPEDLETFRLLHFLIKERKMTLEGARKYVLENQETVDRKLELIERLENIKAKLNRVLEVI